MAEQKKREWCNKCAAYLPHGFLISKCMSCGDPHLPQHWGDNWCEECLELPRAGFTDHETRDIHERGYTSGPTWGTRWPTIHGRHVPVLFFPSVEQRDEALAVLREHFA